MTAPLFAPDPERIASSNAWALLRSLAPTAAVSTDGPAVWSALRAAIAADPPAAAAAFTPFAGCPAAPACLILPPAPPLRLHPLAVRAAPAEDQRSTQPPATLAAALARPWDPAHQLAARAALLLHADLRPDDVVLLAGLPPDAWLPALTSGTTLIVSTTTPAALLPLAAETGATVLAAPAGWIAAAAFPRPDRLHLAALRSVIALGGPMAPASRARVYAWIKPDVMLLAQAGDRWWGNPLSPVCARPVAERALFRDAMSGR
ncbi:MAG: hypothetical protein HIU82_22150 [Proteobacteria bacterium]|nr:hypothetical protein [Pseudomonadota bacterium]